MQPLSHQYYSSNGPSKHTKRAVGLDQHHPRKTDGNKTTEANNIEDQPTD